MSKIYLILLAATLLSTQVYSGESVIVLSDNTVIRTVEGKKIVHQQFELIKPEITDPVGDATCFDMAKKHQNRRKVYEELDRCIHGTTNMIMGTVA